MQRNPIVADRFALEKRVKRFVVKEFSSSPIVGPFLERLMIAGKSAIFGGLIRDLALGHARSFSSDADIVVDQVESGMLDQVFSTYKAKKNKYGGYRINIGRWLFDIWSIDSTWAFRENLISHSSIESLLDTTFFNWDAALFDLDENHIICSPTYIDDLAKRRLASNLLDTPNQLGAAVKTLRLLSTESPTLEPQLARFLYSAITNYGISELVKADQTRTSQVRLTVDFVGSLAIALAYHQRNSPDSDFDGIQQQRCLFAD